MEKTSRSLHPNCSLQLIPSLLLVLVNYIWVRYRRNNRSLSVAAFPTWPSCTKPAGSVHFAELQLLWYELEK